MAHYRVLSMGNLLPTLYQFHELSIRTLYAEVKQRAQAAGELLPGTPGTLVKRQGTGYEYWYRSYYDAPQKLRTAAIARLPRLQALLAQHPQAQEELRRLR